MRLIPGKTKVQIELFKGISLWDILIGGIGAAMIILVLVSSLPFKMGIAIGILIIFGMLLIRMDTEPTYVMALNILKHLAYSRRYEKVYDDEMILKKSNGTLKQDLVNQYRKKNQEVMAEREGAENGGEGFEQEAYADGDGQYSVGDEAYFAEDGEYPTVDSEPEVPYLSEKEIIKLENKILKSKKASNEEKDAVWLARANRTAAKKEAKKRGEKLTEFPASHLGELAETGKGKAKDKAGAAGKGKAKDKAGAAGKGKDGDKAGKDKKGIAGAVTAEESQEGGRGKNVAKGKKGKAALQAGEVTENGTEGVPEQGGTAGNGGDAGSGANVGADAESGLSEKELIKRENAILKSKTATPEEKDAVWLARAQRSAAKKEAQKQAKKERTDNKEYDFMENIMAFTNVKDDFIEYGGKYYGTVIEIDPVEFRFFSEHRRNNSIELGVGRVLRSVHVGFAANIVKLERPIIYDKYLAKEREKLEQLRKSYESGMMSEAELQARVDIENDRLAELEGLCSDKEVVAPFYYIALFESDKKQLELQTKDALDALSKGEMTVRRLNTKELAIFLKYTNQLDFNERDIEKYQPEDYAQWAMPQRVNVKVRTVEVNDIVTHNFRVVKYPSWVGDAWLANVLSMPATKVVIKCSPMDRGKAIRTIDHSLQELRAQYNATGVDSKRIELENHINTLGGLLATLQGEGEELLECNIYVTAYDVQSTRLALGVEEFKTMLPEISAMKKTIRRSWQENNFRLNDNFFNQMNAFIGSQVSAYDPEAKNGRGIPSNSLAACYPWVYAHISDEGGFKLGSSSGVPVFIDFFRRDSERVNSNMVIIGKSGSGKSYATKSILSNLASEDAKIFILDPENEYSELAHNLHGKVINVANAQYGRLNPFHIITALDDDEGGSAAGSFATHLQFLEEFYRQILPEIEKDALEYLNNLTERLYTNRGITPDSDLSKLRPEDYPVFDDLYDAVLEEFERTENEYIRSMLRTLINYVAKFSTGGRNANIWNGPSTVTTDENFTVFNFQAMLSNRNTTIANAQMLLVLKYIDNEIIKNRDYNSKYGLKRKVVVVIDEAHVFIDAKFPIALDFMFQLAKRIRKYNGMQVVITQNIKDFVGSEELARKSTAIINACQYSFIFALAPNDMHDLCTLYEKAGGISEIEQEQIIQAPRGQAFTVMSATSRSTFKVEVPKNMVDMFQDRDFSSRYYTGTDGEAAWDNFIGGSRKTHDLNSKANKKAEVLSIDDARQEKKNWVVFEELTEEEAGSIETARSVQKSMPTSGRISFEEVEEAKPGQKAKSKSGGISFEEIDATEDIVSSSAGTKGFASAVDEEDDFGMSDEDMDAMIAQHMAQKAAEERKQEERAIASAGQARTASVTGAFVAEETGQSESAFATEETGRSENVFAAEETGRKESSFVEEETDDFGMSDEDMDAMIARRLAQKAAGKTEREERAMAGADQSGSISAGVGHGFGKKERALEPAPRRHLEVPEDHRSKDASGEVTQAIGELKNVLADFVQAVRQPAAQALQPMAQPGMSVSQTQQPDYDSIVADVREQVMARLLEEIRAGGMIPGGFLQGAPANEVEGNRYGTGASDEEQYEPSLSDEEELDLEEAVDLAEDLLEIDTEKELTEEEQRDLEAPEEDEEELLEAEEELEEAEEEEVLDDDYDFDSLFEEEETEGEASYADSDVEEDEEGGFDIMSMLRAEARAMVDSKKAQTEADAELSDYAEEGGVADISMEDLAKIVTMLRKKKRAKG